MTAPLTAQTVADDTPVAFGGAYGVLAEFDDPGTLYHACEGVRDAGFSAWDAHTPFPVHGLEKAMGLKASPVGWFVLIMGLGGAAVGMHMQWLVSTSLYPLVISGKPLFSWPAFVPIMFECGVLGGAAGAILGFLSMSKLPRHHHPLFTSERFERVGDDRFFISIEADDAKFQGDETIQMLRDLGAQHVEWIDGDGR
ncbi:MAG: DUF3341 domain-containing protein [Acidobacteriota bacterium]